MAPVVSSVLVLAAALLLGPADALALPASSSTDKALLRRSPVYNLAGDPPYSVSEAALAAAIDCPTGNTNPKTVLLVPGTGEGVRDIYEPNFGALLPANDFPVCYLNIPMKSLGDAQTNSEYVAYGINFLAYTTGAPIRILTHSQGGLNAQWALTFFPSTRANTKIFTALAPDYRGTDMIDKLVIYSLYAATHMANAAALQQASDSNFVHALAAHGGLASLARTNNLYTRTDEVVMPEVGPRATSVLGGSLATNIAVQDICPGRIVGHFGTMIDVITQFFTLQSFTAPDGRADPSLLTPAERLALCLNVLPRFKSVPASVQFGLETLEVAIRTGFTGAPGSMVSAEPPLRPYAQ